MPALKTEAITLRLTPETKAVLRQSAEQESRSMSNMVEVMIRDYSCRRHPANGQPDTAMLADPTEHPSRSCAS